MAGKKLEAFRKWFTPRKRLWAGIALLVTATFGPLLYPGFNGYWGIFIAPGIMFLCSAWNPEDRAKRL
ncbi:hypothetical protein [Pseudomonas sp. Xaverov 259]|uniref:hypothetical protein n=1 Tax=Pseudomonas TaxID=286 RepID=UPI001C5BE7BB|nr:hypothetical protein [Pseudomonas sp. Xaverov 259]